MAETIVYRRKRAKRPFDYTEAGRITTLTNAERYEKIIIYERRKLRKKQVDDLHEDVTIKSKSTGEGHEKVIVYKRRNLRKMQLKCFPETRRMATVPTAERQLKMIRCERGMHRETQLNDLPEEILCSIVSRLPLRDAVRTSMVSTKMRRLWTCHPNLTFSKRAMFPESKIRGSEKFKLALIKGMHDVLKQHRGREVERIFLEAFLDQNNSASLNACVRFAISSGAKSLSLLLSPERPYCFPTCLFDTRRGSRSVLEELSLRCVSLRILPGFSGFTQLKRLELLLMHDIVADELQDLLNNCLSLECLSIKVVYKFEKLVISQALSHLRCLSLTGCHKVKRIEIGAANLRRFEYEGRDNTDIVFTQPLPEVRYASIECGIFNSHVGEFVFGVLPSSLPGLETLVWKTQGVEMEGLPNCPRKFQCLKTVHIELCAMQRPYAGDVLSFAALLDAAPSLESFSLKLIGFFNNPYSGIEEFRRLPGSLHHRLKSVEFKEFTCSRDQIELVEYINENATALENIIIKTKAGCYKDAAIESTFLKKDRRMEIL